MVGGGNLPAWFAGKQSRAVGEESRLTQENSERAHLAKQVQSLMFWARWTGLQQLAKVMRLARQLLAALVHNHQLLPGTAGDTGSPSQQGQSHRRHWRLSLTGHHSCYLCCLAKQGGASSHAGAQAQLLQ